MNELEKLQKAVDSVVLIQKVHNSDWTHEEWAANQRAVKLADELLKAAPETAAERDRLKKINKELLNALKDVAGLVDGKVNGDDNDDMRDWEKSLMRINAAIAKAEGR